MVGELRPAHEIAVLLVAGFPKPPRSLPLNPGFHFAPARNAGNEIAAVVTLVRASAFLVPKRDHGYMGGRKRAMFKPAAFKALVHHIIARVENPSQLGAVKLNKCAWFVDGQTYLRTGETLTGARYTKMPQGPVPKAMLPILRELQEEGKIAVETVDYYGRGKRQYRLLAEPPADVFDEATLGCIHEITDIIAKTHTATSISELTHGAAWKLADDGEDLPFHAVLADDLQPVTEEDVAWARERMEKFEKAA